MSVSQHVKPCCQLQNQPINGKKLKQPSVYDDWQNTDWWKSLKNNLDNGIKDPRCMKCWQQEDRGLLSARQKVATELITYEPFSHLDLKLGNKCNLKCRMCDSNSSSLIQKELEENQDLKWSKMGVSLLDPSAFLAHQLKTYSNWYEDPKIYQKIKDHAHQVRTLKFTGGEPTVIEHVHDLIDWFVQTGHCEHIQIELITNGTNKRMKIYDNMLKFRSARLQVSCDGSEDTYNYIRYPYTWKKFVKNMENLKPYSNKIDIGLIHTSQVLNIMNLKEFEKWCTDNKWSMHTNSLYWPYYYNIENLPEDSIQKIIKYLSDGGIECKRQLNRLLSPQNILQGQDNELKIKNARAWRKDIMWQLFNDTQIKDKLRKQDGELILAKLNLKMPN